MLCVIAKLDPEATEKLRLLQTAALEGRKGYPPLYGHITLAAWIGENEEGFVRACGPLVRSVRPFTVTYRSVEALTETSILAAVPEKVGGLLRLHARIAERFGASLNGWTAGNSWVPHTTLLFDPGADLMDLRDRVREVFVPFRTVVRRIEFSRVLEDGYRIVESTELDTTDADHAGSANP